jgi:hypothetical protein
MPPPRSPGSSASGWSRVEARTMCALRDTRTDRWRPRILRPRPKAERLARVALAHRRPRRDTPGPRRCPDLYIAPRSSRGDSVSSPYHLLAVQAVVRREGEQLHETCGFPQAPRVLPYGRSPTETEKPPSSLTRTSRFSPGRPYKRSSGRCALLVPIYVPLMRRLVALLAASR